MDAESFQIRTTYLMTFIITTARLKSVKCNDEFWPMIFCTHIFVPINHLTFYVLILLSSYEGMMITDKKLIKDVIVLIDWNCNVFCNH